VKVSMLLDSGAFSAWTQQDVVDLDAYIDFIKANESDLEYYVNLDKIPGQYGGLQHAYHPTREEFEESARQGYKNYEHMLSRGIDPQKLIHVFHQHEDWSWLKRMVREIPYVGLSPSNDSTHPSKKKWLDECMMYTTDDQGFPLVKTHGFAVTSVVMMVRYPWYSCDSMSWRLSAGYGAIFIPDWNDKGEYIYDKPPIVTKVTIHGKNREIVRRLFESLSTDDKEMVVRYVESKGFKMGRSVMESGKEKVVEEGLVNSHHQREVINLIYFEDFLSRLVPFPHRRYMGKELLSQGFNFS